MTRFLFLGLSMALGAWFFMVSLKRVVYKSKISPKSGFKSHELYVPSLLDV
jgi:hypothetical protein